MRNNILAEEQSGFRSGRSTMDNCFVLDHLITKFKFWKKPLYVAFIDLKAAFDTIDRQILWDKLEAMGIEKKLLYLIRLLYTETQVRVRVNRTGSVTNAIPIKKGVRQGCILAPTLFNLYLNDLPKWLEDISLHGPSIGTRQINCLLYADDIVLLSASQVGLRRSLGKLAAYCIKNRLTINVEKSKVMVFSRQQNMRRWVLNDRRIEQVQSFTYLGLVFQTNSKWNKQVKAGARKAMARMAQLNKLILEKTPSSLIPVLKVFQAKIEPVITYGAEIWGSVKLPGLETPQNKFLRRILAVSPGTPACVVRAETGVHAIGTRASLKTVYYWLRIIEMEEGRLPKLALMEQIISSNKNNWLSRVLKQVSSSGIPLNWQQYDHRQIRNCIAQRLKDISAQSDIAQVTAVKVCPWLSANKQIFKIEKYLTVPLFPVIRRFFTKLRLEQLQTNMLWGRYKGIPVRERVCLCGTGEVETTSHVIFDCPLYSDLRKHQLGRIFYTSTPKSKERFLQHCLLGSNLQLVKWIAKFAVKLMEKRTKLVQQNVVDCRKDHLM